ncbi:hypothetical protein [Candidatus Vidania fulgoroideorum]
MKKKFFRFESTSGSGHYYIFYISKLSRLKKIRKFDPIYNNYFIYNRK